MRASKSCSPSKGSTDFYESWGSCFALFAWDFLVQRSAMWCRNLGFAVQAALSVGFQVEYIQAWTIPNIVARYVEASGYYTSTCFEYGAIILAIIETPAAALVGCATQLWGCRLSLLGSRG